MSPLGALVVTTPINTRDFPSLLDRHDDKAENLVDPQCNQPKSSVLSWYPWTPAAST